MKFQMSIAAMATSLLTLTSALDTCTMGLAGLLGNNGVNSCLPIIQGTELLTNNLTMGLVQNVTSAFCTLPACSASTISLIQSTILQNCVANDTTTTQTVMGLASLYQPIRTGLCTQVGNGNTTYCTAVFAQSLLNYMATNPAPVNSSSLFDPSSMGLLDNYIQAMPADILCTNCNKGIISPVVNYIQQHQADLASKGNLTAWANSIEQQIDAKCGANFTDGNSNLTSTANGSTSADSNNQSSGSGTPLSRNQGDNMMGKAALAIVLAMAAMLL